MPATLFWPPLGIKVPREFGRTPAGRARLCGEAWGLQWLGWWHQQALRENVESDIIGVPWTFHNTGGFPGQATAALGRRKGEGKQGSL